MRVTHIFAAAVLALVSTFSFADTAAEQAIRKSLETLKLDVPVESISASPMAGLYEVKLKGSRVLYAALMVSSSCKAICFSSRTVNRST